MQITVALTWQLLNILNTCVSVFGIIKLKKAVRDLKKMEPNLKNNLWMQTIHGVLLGLQLLASISFTLYYFQILNFSYFAPIFIYLIDFLVQALICYICIVQGSDTALNRFECFIWTDQFGIRRLKFKLRESFLKNEVTTMLRSIDIGSERS